MRYLHTGEITWIHDLVVEATGGTKGIREKGLLESIVAKPKTTFGGRDLYPDVFAKAAAIYEAISSYHVFVDGNKRTAVLAADRFLYINGYSLEVSNDELVSYTLKVATNHLDLAVIAEWIRRHARLERSEKA
jgi:death-on-curing protein